MLLVPVLASCASKSHKPKDAPPAPPDSGQMRELPLPRMNAPPTAPAAAQSATQPSATAQSSPAAQPATQPSAAASRAAPPDATAWPLEVSGENVKFEVHEPVTESWDKGVLVARSLVLAQPAGEGKPVPGSVTMKAVAEVNSAAGVVSLVDLEVLGADFSTAPGTTQAWRESLRSSLPGKIKTVGLAHLEEGRAAVQARQQAGAAASVLPPRILISEKPVVLVYIDGDPRYVPLKGTNWTGVLNTNVLLLKDPAGTLYLRIYDGWVSSPSLQGPWQVASAPPGAAQLEQTARATGRVNLLPGKPDANGRSTALSDGPLPRILVATAPTALIILDGAPRFTRIPGTSLEYATNTSAHLLRDTESRSLYVRVGGYWFRAGDVNGPWEHVPIASLPQGFSMIPDDSPKRGVKTSVVHAKTSASTTDRAWNIVAADPSSATLSYSLAGDPVLKPIRGTQLNYVANASVPMIQVDINNWYAVQEGVWFHAAEATGPWTVTKQVPPEIYAIPPTAPIYRAIQSRAISSSTDVVYYGYSTPDSLGPEGGAIGVEDQGADYQYTPPSNLYWGWFY